MAEEAALPLERFEVITLNDWVDHYEWKYPLLGPLVDVHMPVESAKAESDEGAGEWRVLDGAAEG